MAVQLCLDLPAPGPVTPLPEVSECFSADWRVTYSIRGERSSRVIEAGTTYDARRELLRLVPGASILSVRLEP